MVKNVKENGQNASECEPVCESDAPNGDIGAAEAPACKCGAPLNATATRCRNGHLLPGHTASLIVGHRSMAFWNAAQDALSAIVTDVLHDAGHTPADAPRALTAAAEGLAQAVLIRDAAFDRLRVLGGPTSASNDRARRSFVVWATALASTERHLKLIGLKRRQRHVDPMVALQRAVERANSK
jgi:hypothetical protein